MLDFSKFKYNCTGCSACASVCPKQSIEMRPDEEGHLYPELSGDCIQCGMCKKICPVINHFPGYDDADQIAYAGIVKDDAILQKSTSGGAFYGICTAFADGCAKICGAAFDGFKVHHIIVDGVKNITPLQKSKYVFSHQDNCFREIQDLLKKGEKVIYSGTPCEVAGLRSFLSKEYENLLLVDLICHGAGSPDVFESSIKLLEKKYNTKILSYGFRIKDKSLKQRYMQQITCANGDVIYLTEDPYILLFLQQDCLRPSCGKHCQFRTSHRHGDITIADFNGLDKVFPKLNVEGKGYSSIVANTAKGKAVVENLSNTMTLHRCAVRDIENYNPLFYRQTYFTKNRDAFFKDYKKDKNAAIMKYAYPKEKFVTRLFHLLPESWQIVARNLKNRIR